MERIGDHFEGRVALPREFTNQPLKGVTKQDVYASMDAEPLRWNRDKLSIMVRDPVHPHTLLGERILDIWSNLAFYTEETRMTAAGRNIKNYPGHIQDEQESIAFPH